MKQHEFDLSSFHTQGFAEQTLENGLLHVTVTRSLPTRFDNLDTKINSYVSLPGTYRLPLRIDLTARIDSPGLFLLLGNGRVNFGTPWSDNRRLDDIVEPDGKSRFFANQVPMNEFAELSVLYDRTRMQILVNGEERFYSEKERYMRSKQLQECNDEGFSLKLTCSKHADLVVKALTVTEYKDDAAIGILHDAALIPKPITTNEAVGEVEKPTFEACISLFPDGIRDEVVKTDAFLSALRPMRFKRVIEKHGNKVTWVASDYGFSYAIHPSNDIMTHTLQWYVLTNCKPELWHRKADRMEETLQALAGQSPEFAGRMFSNLMECNACTGSQCLVRTRYEFNGKQKAACHGKMEFRMIRSDFEDVRRFIETANSLQPLPDTNADHQNM